jgi:hypothetical protein
LGFGINGRTFEMNRVATDEHVKLGTLDPGELAAGWTVTCS